jgi:ribonuclease HI
MVTDSQYLRLGVTRWLPDWVARGWRRRAGEVQNLDLWRRLHALSAEHEVTWDWVKGHSGDPHNERADQLATAAIRAHRPAAAAPAAEDGPRTEVYLRVSGTGGRGTWAALVRRPPAAGAGEPAPGPEEEPLRGAAAGVSPNQLDLLAAATALESLPRGAPVAVFTGSDYLRHGATRWLPAWRRRGWKTQEGKPVANRALWERLEAAMAGRRVAWPEPGDAELAELARLGKLLRG